VKEEIVKVKQEVGADDLSEDLNNGNVCVKAEVKSETNGCTEGRIQEKQG
jgi:hypothetical protein